MSRSGPRADWAVAHLAAVRARWLEGASTGAIAAEFGVSKNAVIGMAHRNGFPARANPIPSPSRPAVRKTDGAAKRVRRVARAPKAKAATGADRRAPWEVREKPSGAAFEERSRVRAAAAAPEFATPRVVTVDEITRASLFGIARRAAAPVAQALRATFPAGALGAASSCQWPLWGTCERAPSPPLFCGAPSVAGRSWCAAHYARVFRPAAEAP